MSISTILSNSFGWRRRTSHQVLQNQDDHDEENPAAEIIDLSPQERNPPESSLQRTEEPANNSTGTPSTEVLNSDQNDVDNTRGSEGDNIRESELDSISGSENAEEDQDDIETAPVLALEGVTNRPSLRELEEEREGVRRRTSVCLLLAIFFLFRLWVEALTRADLIYLMLCMVLTSWCARYIRHNREQEEELDRRIANYGENGGEDDMNRPELRMLSFQAQLALAIMESQRQMMEGGYGNPDGQDASDGVGNETRDKWERFNFKTVEGLVSSEKKKGAYGIVSQADDEEPCCTICLCEYENGEKLVRLPCGHVYHDDCITSWTDGHNKCPLCNCDLESMAETESSSQPPSLRNDE